MPSTSKQAKRPHDNEDVEMDSTPPNPQNIKKQCNVAPQAEPSNIVSKEYLLNFPITGDCGKVCHLKIYKDAELLKLNSICDFVGFLSVDPALICQNDEEMDDIEFQTHNPPPSLIPRIHCVAFKNIQHCNPLIEGDENQMDEEKMQFVRKELLILLTQLLFGDDLAAEYLIYHLISEV